MTESTEIAHRRFHRLSEFSPLTTSVFKFLEDLFALGEADPKIKYDLMVAALAKADWIDGPHLEIMIKVKAIRNAS